MGDTPESAAAAVVPARADRDGEVRTMGISTLTFKVVSRDSGGALCVVEQENHAKGGPPRHVHPDQDEWFYAVDGAYVVEVAGALHNLEPGDSLLAPRGVPHTWAFVGGRAGRLIVAFTPAGDMEAFFRVVTATDAMPAQDPELWLAHGMRVVGPPLSID